MSKEYRKFQELKLDTSFIGLAHEEEQKYFCTPVGSKIIGWDNGIHYVFIEEFDEMVFAVNPDTCCDYYVYPLSDNFYDFLSLILATKNTNVLQQIIHWDKAQYLDFIASSEEIEYTSKPEVVAILEAIHSMGVLPMKNPFEYVKKVQYEFPYSKIVYRNEFYEVTGSKRTLEKL